MAFHNLYRPKTLDTVIGHEKAVSILKGWVSSGSFPSAVLFKGPTGCGKTTLARAFASEVLGSDCSVSPDFLETNFSESRTIEDVRGLIQVSRLSPRSATRRFILCDEAQGILSTPASANAFLKPLEEPSHSTTWLLTSMDGDKFKSTQLGKAIASRCTTISLDYPSDDELLQQAALIRKKAKLRALTRENLEYLVSKSEGSFRVLANYLEEAAGVLATNGEISEEDLKKVLSHEVADDELLVKFVVSLLSLDLPRAIRTLLDVKDGVGFLQRFGWQVVFLMNQAALDGQKHPKAWGNWKLLGAARKYPTFNVRSLAFLNSLTVTIKLSAGAFAVDERQSLAKLAYEFISTEQSREE